MGMVQATSLSLISTLYPNDMMKYIGYLETGCGIGNAAGPLIGSGLFELGGYSTPFWTFCGCFLLMFLLAMVVLPADRKDDKDSFAGSIIISG